MYSVWVFGQAFDNSGFNVILISTDVKTSTIVVILLISSSGAEDFEGAGHIS